MLEPWTPSVTVHAVLATGALGIGGFNVFRRTRGDALHKAVGRTWAILMTIVAASGLVIVSRLSLAEMAPVDWFLAGLSVWTLYCMAMGVWTVRRGHIGSHRAFMVGTYVGLIGALIGVLAVPSRRVPSYFVAYPVAMSLVTSALAALSAAAVWAMVRATRVSD